MCGSSIMSNEMLPITGSQQHCNGCMESQQAEGTVRTRLDDTTALDRSGRVVGNPSLVALRQSCPSPVTRCPIEKTGCGYFCNSGWRHAGTRWPQRGSRRRAQTKAIPAYWEPIQVTSRAVSYRARENRNYYAFRAQSSYSSWVSSYFHSPPSVDGGGVMIQVKPKLRKLFLQGQCGTLIQIRATKGLDDKAILELRPHALLSVA